MCPELVECALSLSKGMERGGAWSEVIVICLRLWECGAVNDSWADGLAHDRERILQISTVIRRQLSPN
jgi:hypothetical protein